METPRWLDEEEQALWRSWLGAQARMHAAIQCDLRERSSLTESEFGVLVNLTDHEGDALRMGELARLLEWDRSRISHQISRMERRGLVRRNACAGDARGFVVEVTPAGRDAIEQAAPGHVETVRRAFFDRLDAADREALARVLRTLSED